MALSAIHQRIMDGVFDNLVSDITNHFANPTPDCDYCGRYTTAQLAQTAYDRTVEAIHAYNTLDKADTPSPKTPTLRMRQHAPYGSKLPAKRGSRGTFDQWKHLVNRVIFDKLGLDSDDLPDMPYRDWYDDGVGAHVAASRAIRKARNF